MKSHGCKQMSTPGFIIVNSQDVPVVDRYNTIIMFVSREDAEDAINSSGLILHKARPLVKWRKPRKKRT